MDIIEAIRKNLANLNEPYLVKDLSEHGQILYVQFSPFEWSQDVLLVGFREKILLAHLDISDKVHVKILTEISHQARCTTISISAETSLAVLPNQVVFCTGGNDFKLRIFSSDLEKNSNCLVIGKHASYINDTSYDPENNYLASTSDDNTAKIWSVDGYKLKCTFNLTSAGMNVCWHRSDQSKLMVAERIGIVRFYNVESETPILSLDYNKPLSSSHWAPSDGDSIATLQLGELLIWDVTKPCLPLHNSIIYTENGGHIKFSPQGELIAAVNSLDNSLKIIHVKSQAAKLTTSVTLPTNISWHYRYPMICVGDDFKLCFWKV